MPKFSCTVTLGINSLVRLRTSGWRRWPPLWITRSEDKSNFSISGSLIKRINNAGTTAMCVTRCRSICAKISSLRVEFKTTNLPPCNR